MKYSHYLTVSETTDLGETFAIKLNENVKQVETYLMHTFFSYLNEHDINDVFNYLDYHYSHYTQRNPGKELSFLYFVNECTRGNGMVETLNGKTMKMYTPIYESRGETVRDWIEAKKNELQPPGTTGNQREPVKSKRIKQTDMNKPVLNQVQISILFRIMKDMNIITNRDLSKKDFSYVIQTLTGYSKNTIRANLSASQYIEISDTPRDYKEIINTLYSVIEKLEKAMNEINTGKKRKL